MSLEPEPEAEPELNPSIGLILYGQIVNFEHLEKRLKYYKQFITNIILITFEISVIKQKKMLLKYIDEDNLILIPSNKTGENIPNKKKITPFKITQPNVSFYYDSSWYKISNDDKLKGACNKYCVYKYFTLYGQKYDYYLLFRNDIDISLNEFILNTMINKANNDKIILSSLSYYTKLLNSEQIDNCMSNNKHFIIKHPGQSNNNNTMCFYTSLVYYFGKYMNLFNYLNIICNNKKLDYIIWHNGESWLIGPYILINEKINETKNKEHTEELINKYFDFIDNCYNDGNHIYLNRHSIKKKLNNYTCFICKKKIFD